MVQNVNVLNAAELDILQKFFKNLIKNYTHTKSCKINGNGRSIPVTFRCNLVQQMKIGS